MSATVTPEPAAPTTWEQHHEAGRRRFAEGDAAGAEQAFRAAIAHAERPGGDPLQLASSLSSLGQLKYQQKEYAGAEECFRRSFELREAALGAEHPTVISGINNLAALYVARGALDEAEPLLQRAMGVTLKRVEATQAELAVNLNNLVRLYVKRGDYARAEPLVVRLLALKRPFGPEHPEVAAVLVTLAKLRQSMGQSEAAERLWRRVLAVRQRTLPPNDPLLASTLDGLADACAAQNKAEQELAVRERALAVRTAAEGPAHPSIEAVRARITTLQEMIRANAQRGTPSSSASTLPSAGTPPAGPPTATPGAAMSGISGLTGVIPNVIPEAIAISRAFNERAERNAQASAAGATPPPPLRDAPSADPRPATDVDTTDTTDTTRHPDGSPSRSTPASIKRERPSPIPDVRQPTPIPELDTSPAEQATTVLPALGGRAESGSAPRPRSSGPTNVNWIEPAHVIPPSARHRRSDELTRPKLNMGTRHSPAPATRARMISIMVAAAVVAIAVVAAMYGRHQLYGDGQDTGAHSPAAAVNRGNTPTPATEPSSDVAPATPAPPNAESVTGGGAAPPASAASGPNAAESSSPPAATSTPVSSPSDAAVPTGDEAERTSAVGPTAKAVATPVRLPTTHLSAPKPAPAHHRVPAPQATDLDAIPPPAASINIDAATRAIDDTVRSRGRTSPTP